MKTFTVNNLSLQFNQHDDNDSSNELVAQKFIDSLNEHIKSFFSDSCPQIMSIQVGPEQVHVEDDSITELPESEEEHIKQTDRTTLGQVEEILIKFGIKDIFHSHLILIITRKDKGYHSSIKALDECDNVVLNRIFSSDDKTEICWNEDSSWEEAISDAIGDEFSGSQIGDAYTNMINDIIDYIHKIIDGYYLSPV